MMTMLYTKTHHTCGKCSTSASMKVVQQVDRSDRLQVSAYCQGCSTWVKWLGRQECIDETDKNLFGAWEQNQMEQEATQDKMVQDALKSKNVHDEVVKQATDTKLNVDEGQAIPTSVAIYTTQEGKDVVDFCRDLLQYVEAESAGYQSTDDLILHAAATLVRTYKRITTHD